MPKDVKIEDITVTTDLTSDLSSATVQVEVVYSVGPLGNSLYIFPWCLFEQTMLHKRNMFGVVLILMKHGI
jgi:hypothetical protein